MHQKSECKKTTFYCPTCALLFGYDESHTARVCIVCANRSDLTKIEYKFNPRTFEAATIPQNSFHVKNAQDVLNEVIKKRQGNSNTQIVRKRKKAETFIDSVVTIQKNGARVKTNNIGLDELQANDVRIQDYVDYNFLEDDEDDEDHDYNFLEDVNASN